MIKKERLQKVIAHSGYTSRRKAEKLIADKRVRVNGEIVSEMGSKVSVKDIIHVDNQLIVEEKKVYYLINKPENVLSSVSDDRGRNVIVDLVDDKRRIYPVGRLDFDTTGLLILTNDGDFTHAMIHPSFEVYKTYEVVVDSFINDTMLNKLKTGVMIDDYKTLPAKVVVNNFDKAKQESDVTITIREGKNRQVKRMFEAVDTKVANLHRSQVGFMTLDGLEIGEYRKLKMSEVEKLIKEAKTGAI